jgi:hypothetical protein
MASIIGVETLQHTNGTDAININSSGKVILNQVGTGEFYRTGTWTPVWTSSGATDNTASITSGTYAFQTGQYIRIGDLVNFTGYLQSPSSWSYTNGGANSQSVYIAGLPFKGANSNAGLEQWAVVVPYIQNFNGFSAGYSLQGMVRNNENFIRFFYNTTNNTISAATELVASASSFIYFSGSYRTEDA